MFGPELIAGVPRVQGDLGPGLEDEPAARWSTRTRSTRTCAWAPTTTRRSRRRTSTSPTTTAASRARPLRCVGVGKCRKRRAAAPCARATWSRSEEKHSTRGRAHLLFEMLKGELLTDGWKSEAVKRGARPVPGLQGLQERLPGQRGHGHLQGRVPVALLRGPAAAAARLRDGPDLLVGPARLARCRGWPTSSPRRRVSATLAKWLGGIAPQRDDARRSPPQTFKDWFAPPAAAATSGKPPVILWPDTFNNYFHPRSRRPRSRCWRHAGFQVIVPAGSRSAAAGRSTTSACSTPPRRCSGEILDTLRPEIEAGMPDRRARAELRRRLPRRADQPLPARRGRQAAARADVPRSSEFLDKKAHGLPAAAAAAQGARPRPLPPQGAS